jgi:hypothetical protein
VSGVLPQKSCENILYHKKREVASIIHQISAPLFRLSPWLLFAWQFRRTRQEQSKKLAFVLSFPDNSPYLVNNTKDIRTS